MSINNKTKNVKLSTELVDSVYKRNPDAPAGATLLEIYKEYEKLEALAKCIDPTADLSKISVFDVVSNHIKNEKERNAEVNKSIDDLKIMLTGLEKFFNLKNK